MQRTYVRLECDLRRNDERSIFDENIVYIGGIGPHIRGGTQYWRWHKNLFWQAFAEPFYLYFAICMREGGDILDLVIIA